MTMKWDGARVALLAAADAAVLVALRPDFAALGPRLGRLPGWLATDTDRALGTLAAAGVWLAAAWLAAGLCCVALTRVPGRAGRLARRTAALLLPRVVQRLVAGSAGLGVLLAPAAALASPGPSPAPPRPAATASAAPGTQPAIPAPSWPVSPGSPVPRLPTPRWPTDPAPARPTAPPAAAPARQVLVRPGDSLWLIAARRLGADATPARIAAEWPRWYAANADRIGPDPNLLQPGQRLRAPDPAADNPTADDPTADSVGGPP